MKKQALVPAAKMRKIRIYARWNKLYRKVLKNANGKTPNNNNTKKKQSLQVQGRFIQLINRYVIFKGESVGIIPSE